MYIYPVIGYSHAAMVAIMPGRQDEEFDRHQLLAQLRKVELAAHSSACKPMHPSAHTAIERGSDGHELLASELPVVYLFSLNALELEIGDEAANAVLSEDERMRLARMRAPARRREFAFGHFALRALLAQHCGADSPRLLQLRLSEFGRPALGADHARTPLNFNLSHARDLLAVALCNRGTIGVDIEWTRPCLADEFVELGERNFHWREAQRLRRLAPMPRHDEFYRMWTLKEAALKALGLGLSAPLDRIVVAEPHAHYRIDVASFGHSAALDAWHWDDIVGGLHLAVASSDSSLRPQIRALHTSAHGLRQALAASLSENLFAIR